MVEVKINIRQLSNTKKFAYQRINLAVGTPDGHVLAALKTYNELLSLNLLYGLIGRKIYWYNEGFHYAIIQEIYSVQGAGRLRVSNWYWRVPLNSTQICFVDISRPDPNRYVGSIIDSKDFSADLIEQDLNIVQQLEYGEKFNLQSSYGSVSLDASSDLTTFMGVYWKPSTLINVDEYVENIFELEITRDGVCEFFGISKISDIIHDQLENKYIFSLYDYLPFMLNTIGDSHSPSAGYFTEFTVRRFLSMTLQAFSTNEPDIQLGDVDDELNFNEYLSYLCDDDEQRSVEEELTLAEFLIEMQKHYGAYLFYNPRTKDISFYNRNIVSGELNIDNLIIEDTFELSYADKEYNGLIVNATTDDGSWTWEGYAIIDINPDGTLNIIQGMGEDEASNLDNYLDLRQKFPSQGFKWYIFPKRSPAERFDDYKELLFQSPKYKCVIDTLDVFLMNRIIYNGQPYIAIRVEKDFLNEQSTIEMVYSPISYPNPFN